MINLEHIRNKIIDGIKKSGMSQTQLANYLDVGQQTISEYLHGKSLPSLDTFANLCAVLKLDANAILCIDEYKFL